MEGKSKNRDNLKEGGCNRSSIGNTKTLKSKKYYPVYFINGSKN